MRFWPEHLLSSSKNLRLNLNAQGVFANLRRISDSNGNDINEAILDKAPFVAVVAKQTMRLYLLPISTRRTLIYCERLNITTSETTTWLDKGTTKAANLWARWEKKESGWQKRVVDYGNQALRRIPYEEWGLKSIPPLSARRKSKELSGKESVEVAFPKTLIPEEKVQDVLRILGTERQSLHQKRMLWSFVGMPISAPFALVPM
jgi:hypothetical protein